MPSPGIMTRAEIKTQILNQRRYPGTPKLRWASSGSLRRRSWSWPDATPAAKNIVRNIDNGTSDRPYSHALVAGINHSPCKVTAALGQKKMAKRSKIKSFVTVYNYSHFMLTRCSVYIPLDRTETLFLNTRPEERPRSSSRTDARPSRTDGSRSCGFRLLF
uniref:60S ribosomal protein L27 n=1 Tax=Felis catus TaxID=9685 RepID=A0ABI7WBB3_FELCA